MTEEKYNYYPSEKEMAEQEAYSMLINSSLQRYVIDKEKESIISSWQEHQENEDENTYHSINYNNWCIIEDGVRSIKSNLDLIIEQLAKNSSKELVERKIHNLNNIYKDYPNCLKDCISYLHYYLGEKHLADLGHTEAWIWLDKNLEKLNKKKSPKRTSNKEAPTPLFIKGNIYYLYKGLQLNDFIEKDYKYEDFKDCFTGKPLKEIHPIKFTKDFPDTSKICLFVELKKQDFIVNCQQKELAEMIGVSENYYKSQKSLQKNSNVTHYQEINTILSSLNSSV